VITREFAPVRSGPKWLTEDPVLRSTIRHQTNEEATLAVAFSFVGEGGADENPRSGFEEHREAMRRRRPTAGGPERQRGPSNPRHADCEQARRADHRLRRHRASGVAADVGQVPAWLPGDGVQGGF